MDERPWDASPDGRHWDASPDVRVSDADRDAVAAELGVHFQEGRLDQAEFDERMARALSARTGRDLSLLLEDLPAAVPPVDAAARVRGGALPWVALAVPLLVAGALAAWFAGDPGEHGFFPWPVFWVIPFMAWRFAWWRRVQRGRQWR